MISRKLRFLEHFDFCTITIVAIAIGSILSVLRYCGYSGFMFWAFFSGLVIVLGGYPIFHVCLLGYIEGKEQKEKKKNEKI